MKKIIVAVALMFLVASNVWAAPGSVSGQGRYQLFQGKYHVSYTDSGGSNDGMYVDSLFRIDTETGKTWVYYVDFRKSASPGQQVIWIPIRETESSATPKGATP